jgi:superfamily II DNA or RNA helicase
MLIERFRRTLGRALVGVDAHTAAQGEAAFADGRVLDLREPATGELEGEVEGEDGATYLACVRLAANGAVTRASVRCTCAAGYDCEHGAALLCAWLDDGPPAGAATRPRPARPAGPLAAPAAGFDAVGRLRALEWVRAVRSVRAAGGAPAGGAIAWVLVLGAADDRPQLQAWRPRVGEPARPYLNVREHASHPPAGWDALDALAGALLLRSPGSGHTFVPTSANACELLLRLARARRLALEAPPGDPASVPLVAGESRPGTLAWRPVPERAASRLAWSVVPSARVLALVRPCWLDRDAGTIGAIDTGVPEPLLEWLHDSPPVPYDAIDEVALALHAQLRERAELREVVPCPSNRPVRERTGVPRPILLLSSGVVRGRDGAPPARALTLACAMQYGDRRLEPLRATSLGVRDADGLTLVLCDHDAERSRLAELRAALLPVLGGEGADGVERMPEPGAPSARPRSPTAEGALPVARMPAAALAAARIVLEVVPALSAAGWTVVDEAALPFRLVQADAIAVDLRAIDTARSAALRDAGDAWDAGRAGDTGDTGDTGDAVQGGASGSASALGETSSTRRAALGRTGVARRAGGRVRWDAGAAAGPRWFDLQVGVRVAGRRVDLAPVLAQVVERGGYAAWVQSCCPDGTVWLRLSEGEVARIEATRLEPLARLVTDWAERIPGAEGGVALRVDAFTAAQLALAIPDAQVPPQLASLARLRERAAEFERLPEVAPPVGLRAALRPYQRDGLAWLQFVAGCGLGGVLADDMGLGKTVQLLAHVALERESGRMQAPVLVVAPTSLVFNWQDEAARHVPSLRVLALAGPERGTRFDAIDAHDLVVTSYALLPRDLQRLGARRWHAVVADEAHRIKNPRTQSAAALRTLVASHRIALSGTPLENHLGELWSVMQFAVPGLLGSEESFRQRFRAPIERRPAGIEAAERLQALERRIRPFLLRRTKSTVLRELPLLTQVVRRVELGREQRDLYESLRAAMDARVREALARSGLVRGRIVVLDALLKLRQACCDPALLELPEARRVAASAKREELLELLHTLVDEGRKVLVFSQFTTMLDRIEAAIDADPRLRRVARSRLDGDTDDRRGAVEAFQQGDAQLFLLSLKAGGVGLNLTAADTVIHYDPWWNPAVQSQATDRAHRIGQDKPVFVYSLVCAGTIEERILQLQSSKRDLAEAVLAGGEAAGTLTQDDLLALFSDP